MTALKHIVDRWSNSIYPLLFSGDPSYSVDFIPFFCDELMNVFVRSMGILIQQLLGFILRSNTGRGMYVMTWA